MLQFQEIAQKLHKEDELLHFRDKFHLPQYKGKTAIYLCGNSLGLQPKTTRQSIENELFKWEQFGVEGHFEGTQKWFEYRKALKPLLAPIVGAYEDEITIMNNLTSNLHFLMVSFYQPKGTRTKILMEAGAFPSDQYAVETQVLFHKLNPETEIIELSPREGELHLRTEDILLKISELGNSLALILLGGVNYYTGQAFDMKTITEEGHKVGAYVGYDLAHAAGNLKLHLHDWEADFAAWCSYKYLNSSPGGVGGIFVHQKHHKADLPRFGGWWGHNEQERFLMKKGFKPIEGADGWQLANEPILLMAALKASLEIFADAGMNNLCNKSEKLTSLLADMILSRENTNIRLLTPTNPNERGCQLSLLVENNGQELFKTLLANQILGDWREPNVIRLSPVPLYNTFEEVYQVGKVLQDWQ